MFKTMKPGLVESILAVVNIPKHRFVGFDGNLCAANGIALGVSEVETESGQMCPVIVTGIALIESGGAISKGASLVSDSTGKAVAASNLTVSVSVPAGSTPVTSDAAQPNLVESISGGVLPQGVNAYAIDEASGSGEIIRIKLL